VLSQELKNNHMNKMGWKYWSLKPKFVPRSLKEFNYNLALVEGKVFEDRTGIPVNELTSDELRQFKLD